jgi:hypothetical protein
MDKINIAMKFNNRSHTPPYIKENEVLTLYNPFYYDLSTTRVTIDPEWASAPGITLMWLLQVHDGRSRLIFGVEADSAINFLAFADRFAMGHNITLMDALSLYQLGHPTLAHIGTGTPRGVYLDEYEIAAYVGDLAHYTGMVGGTLQFKDGSWWIDDQSGRYHPFLQPGSFPQQDAFGTQVLRAVQRAFWEWARLEVGIRDP